MIIRQVLFLLRSKLNISTSEREKVFRKQIWERIAQQQRCQTKKDL